MPIRPFKRLILVQGLVANVFWAPLILKEQFRKLDLLGVVIAIAGGVTVVLSAQADQPKLSPTEIVEHITQRNFEIYLVLAVIAMAVLSYMSPKYGDQYIMIDLVFDFIGCSGMEIDHLRVW